jgi:hypothetical protein
MSTTTFTSPVTNDVNLSPEPFYISTHGPFVREIHNPRQEVCWGGQKKPARFGNGAVLVTETISFAGQFYRVSLVRRVSFVPLCRVRPPGPSLADSSARVPRLRVFDPCHIALPSPSIGRHSASRHSYRPLTIRSTVMGPATIGSMMSFFPGFPPIPSSCAPRSTYRTSPRRCRFFLRRVSSYPAPPPGGAVAPAAAQARRARARPS